MKFYCRMDAAGSLQECFSQCAECRTASETARTADTIATGAAAGGEQLITKAVGGRSGFESHPLPLSSSAPSAERVATPRTDALASVLSGKVEHEEAVPAGFARLLEREIVDLQETVLALSEHGTEAEHAMGWKLAKIDADLDRYGVPRSEMVEPGPTEVVLSRRVRIRRLASSARSSDALKTTVVEVIGHPDQPVSARCILSGCQDLGTAPAAGVAPEWNWRDVWYLAKWYQATHPESKAAAEDYAGAMERAMTRTPSATERKP